MSALSSDQNASNRTPAQAAFSAAAAQARGTVLLFPLALLTLGPYFALWGLPEPPFPTDVTSIVLFIWAFILGVLLHEGLHGAGHVWGNASWADVKFGVHWTSLTPYAQCRVPARARSYRLAVALPGIILGGFPLILGWVTGNWPVTFFGFLMWVAAAGDLLILWVIWAVPADAWVQDHPHMVGCLIVGDPSSSPPSPVSKEEVPDQDAPADTGVSVLYVGLLVTLSLLCATLGFLMALS